MRIFHYFPRLKTNPLIDLENYDEIEDVDDLHVMVEELLLDDIIHLGCLLEQSVDLSVRW